MSDDLTMACLLSRRDALRLLGGCVACVINGSPVSLSAIGGPSPACVFRPEQTEGPYFVDEKLNRSDIRVDPSDKSIRPGVPLRLEFQVSRIAGTACTPLRGAMVDVWHCDAAGVYSDVRDGRFDSRGKQF